MIILAIVFVYLTFCGFAQPFVMRGLVRNCPYGLHYAGRDGDSGNRVDRSCEESHRYPAIAISLLGPLVIPFVIGKVLSPHTKPDKVRKQQEAEIEAAEHRKKLAQIEAETTRVLEQALKE